MLPCGWLKLFHADTGYSFYYSLEMGDYRWVEPPQMDVMGSMERAKMLNVPWSGLSVDDMYEKQKEWFERASLEELMKEGDTLKVLGSFWEEKKNRMVDVVYYVNKEVGEVKWSLSPWDVGES